MRWLFNYLLTEYKTGGLCLLIIPHVNPYRTHQSVLSVHETWLWSWVINQSITHNQFLINVSINYVTWITWHTNFSSKSDLRALQIVSFNSHLLFTMECYSQIGSHHCWEALNDWSWQHILGRCTNVLLGNPAKSWTTWIDQSVNCLLKMNITTPRSSQECWRSRHIKLFSSIWSMNYQQHKTVQLQRMFFLVSAYKFCRLLFWHGCSVPYYL